MPDVIRIFRRLGPLSQNAYEHYADEVQGVRRPVVDDTVYQKHASGAFVTSARRILCPQCHYARRACHCANEPPQTLKLVVEERRRRGLMS